MNEGKKASSKKSRKATTNTVGLSLATGKANRNVVKIQTSPQT